MVDQSFSEFVATVAVELVAAVSHHVRLDAEELQFGVECVDALVWWVVKSPGLVVDDDQTKQLRIAGEHVLATRLVVEIFFLVRAEQSVWVRLEQSGGDLEATSTDADGDASVSDGAARPLVTQDRQRTATDRRPTDR